MLVFTQFREMGQLLQRMLRERHGREPLFRHGGMTRARRDQMVDRFQGDRSERVFLLSLKAGGTGLNLTAASQVVHFDLWWNPAVEAQATDRAYRIGQSRKVQVHRLIARGTFEERIDEMIRAKRELAEMTAGAGETSVRQLPAEELRALFELGWAQETDDVNAYQPPKWRARAAARNGVGRERRDAACAAVKPIVP